MMGISLPCKCGAVHSVPFLCCPSCGSPVLSARPSQISCAVELFSINGSFTTQVVVMQGNLPVEKVEQVELESGVLKIRTTVGGRTTTSTLPAERVYKCLRDGDQALQL
jgi:hypothetical protein